jgi:hypothetical protein
MVLANPILRAELDVRYLAMFTVSTQKLPNTKFVIGGNVGSDVLQQVRSASTKESSTMLYYKVHT